MATRSNPLPWSRRGQPAPKIDTSIPHRARVYDYWLGGKDNFEADRKVAIATATASPGVVQGARDNHAFLGRAVRYIAEQGVAQFLRLSTDITAHGNVHEVAQAVNPAARIAYVDDDPIVMAHARALLRGTPAGKIAYIEADLREPDTVLGHPDVCATIDFAQPVGLVIVGTLMFVDDSADPFGMVRRFTDAIAPGSYLAISHVTADFNPEAVNASARAYNTGPVKFTPRSGAQIARFFEGFTVVEPGLVKVFDWRPDETVVPAERTAGGAYGAVGVKVPRGG
jgi:hypothetical protein